VTHQKCCEVSTLTVGLGQCRPGGLIVRHETPEESRDKEIIEALKLITAGKKKLEGLLKK